MWFQTDSGPVALLFLQLCAAASGAFGYPTVYSFCHFGHLLANTLSCISMSFVHLFGDTFLAKIHIFGHLFGDTISDKSPHFWCLFDNTIFGKSPHFWPFVWQHIFPAKVHILAVCLSTLSRRNAILIVCPTSSLSSCCSQPSTVVWPVHFCPFVCPVFDTLCFMKN